MNYGWTQDPEYTLHLISANNLITISELYHTGTLQSTNSYNELKQ